MKKNRIIVIVVVVLVIVSMAIVLSYSSGTYSNKIKNFAVEDTARVTKIFLANKHDQTILLQRVSDGTWSVNEKYEANPYVINMFLETIQRIRVKHPVPQKSSDFIFKRMSANAVKCEIYEKQYRIDFLGLQLFPREVMTRCYYVGDPTQDNMGTFMLMDGAETLFVVSLPGFRGFVSSRYRIPEKDWRSRRLISCNASDIQSVSLEYTKEPEHSFSINIDDLGKIHFQTPDPNFNEKVVDTLKIMNFLNSFKNINFEGILTYDMDSLRMDSIIRSEPFKILRFKPKNGEMLVLKMYPRILPSSLIDDATGLPEASLDHFYIYDEKELFLAQYFVFDKILRKREYFLISDFQIDIKSIQTKNRF